MRKVIIIMLPQGKAATFLPPVSTTLISILIFILATHPHLDH